jgi:hypothetical protein
VCSRASRAIIGGLVGLYCLPHPDLLSSLVLASFRKVSHNPSG